MILGFHLAHQGDDVLLHLCRLTLRGLLLGVPFRKVPTDHAAADRANYGVVPRVMPSDPAYHRALRQPAAFAVPAVAKASVVAIKAIFIGLGFIPKCFEARSADDCTRAGATVSVIADCGTSLNYPGRGVSAISEFAGRLGTSPGGYRSSQGPRQSMR